MKISYDQETDSLYIRLVDGYHECRTLRLNDEIALNIGAGEVLVGAQDPFGISIISYGELLYMTEKSERREMNLQVVQAFLIEIDIYLINKEIAEIYSQLKNRIFRQFAPKEKNKRRSTRIQYLQSSKS